MHSDTLVNFRRVWISKVHEFCSLVCSYLARYLRKATLVMNLASCAVAPSSKLQGFFTNERSNKQPPHISTISSTRSTTLMHNNSWPTGPATRFGRSIGRQWSLCQCECMRRHLLIPDLRAAILPSKSLTGSKNQTVHQNMPCVLEKHSLPNLP